MERIIGPRQIQQRGIDERERTVSSRNAEYNYADAPPLLIPTSLQLLELRHASKTVKFDTLSGIHDEHRVCPCQ